MNKYNIISILILIIPMIAMIIYSIKVILGFNFHVFHKIKKIELSDLIKSNTIMKHILKNTAEPYNEEQVFNDFKSFVNNSPLHKYVTNIKENYDDLKIRQQTTKEEE